MKKVRRGIGQMLVGELAERTFETLYKTTMKTSELRLEDHRATRNETDYRVLNGSGRPFFRLNIKFFGTLFRNASELVGVEPGDCFALATYKIYQGLQRHVEESLPYVFAVVGVPELTGDKVGAAVPEDLVHRCSFTYASRISGKRDVEDRIVRFLIDRPQPADVRAALDGFAAEIQAAQWRVISARRADKVLREKLFDRVYAVRVRAFAKNYGRAEVDMHFSLSQDLTPLPSFLKILQDHGPQGLSVRLERGEV